MMNIFSRLMASALCLLLTLNGAKATRCKSDLVYIKNKPKCTQTESLESIVYNCVTETLYNGNGVIANINPALEWLKNDNTYSISTDTDFDVAKLIQRYVLAYFYFALNGDGWDIGKYASDKLFLDPHSDECDWHGIGCKEGFVTTIKLWNKNLTGILPRELGELSNLKHIDLGLNKISGPLPEELGLLTKLERLDIYGNKFAGTLPASISQWKKIRFINFGSNSFSGPMFDKFDCFPKLNEFLAHNNGFTGKLPESLGFIKGSKVKRVSMDRNNFTKGQKIPDTWYKGLPKLEHLMLTDLGLGGKLKNKNVKKWKKLRILELIHNSFTGPVPKALNSNNMPNLEYVLIVDSGLTGELSKHLCPGPDITIHIDGSVTLSEECP